MLYMNKWEYQLLVELWDFEKQEFYWADNKTDQRNSGERLNALKQEGWEVISSFPSGMIGTQHNYLLKRPCEYGNDVSRLQSAIHLN